MELSFIKVKKKFYSRVHWTTAHLQSFYRLWYILAQVYAFPGIKQSSTEKKTKRHFVYPSFDALRYSKTRKRASFPYLNTPLDFYNYFAQPNYSPYKRADHHPDRFQDGFYSFHGVLKLPLDFLLQGTTNAFQEIIWDHHCVFEVPEWPRYQTEHFHSFLRPKIVHNDHFICRKTLEWPRDPVQCCRRCFCATTTVGNCSIVVERDLNVILEWKEWG